MSTPVQIQQWQSTQAIKGTRYQYIYVTIAARTSDKDRLAVETYVKGRPNVVSVTSKWVGTLISVEWTANANASLQNLVPKYAYGDGMNEWVVANVFSLGTAAAPTTTVSTVEANIAAGPAKVVDSIKRAVTTTVSAATGNTKTQTDVASKDQCGAPYGGASDFLAEFLGGRDRRFFGMVIPGVKPADQYPECDPRYQKPGTGTVGLFLILVAAGMTIYVLHEVGAFQVIKGKVTK